MFPVLYANRWNDLLPSLEDFGRALTRPSSPIAFDIREEKEGWVIEAEVPGLSKDDVSIAVENGVLTLSGEVRRTGEEKKRRYHVRERYTGSFSRSVVLPETADTGKIEAKLENGVLTLTIPVRPEAKPRRIEVK